MGLKEEHDIGNIGWIRLLHEMGVHKEGVSSSICSDEMGLAKRRPIVLQYVIYL